MLLHSGLLIHRENIIFSYFYNLTNLRSPTLTPTLSAPSLLSSTPLSRQSRIGRTQEKEKPFVPLQAKLALSSYNSLTGTISPRGTLTFRSPSQRTLVGASWTPTPTLSPGGWGSSSGTPWGRPAGSGTTWRSFALAWASRALLSGGSRRVLRSGYRSVTVFALLIRIIDVLRGNAINVVRIPIDIIMSISIIFSLSLQRWC